MSPFEYGLSRIFGPILGGGQQGPRAVPPIVAAPPRPMNPDGTLAPQGGYSPAPQPVTNPTYAQRPQEDALDRFERMARLMELGETVGSAFNKGPLQQLNNPGGVGQPQLPNASQYGLSLGA